MSDEFDDLPDPATLTRPGPPMHPAPSPRALVPRLVSRLYAVADPALRARLLGCLLAPLGTLGVAGIAAGAFAGLLRRSGPLPAEEAAGYTSDQILELARFVEQVSPQALQQAAELLATNPVGLAAFGASAAMLLLRLLGRRG